MDWRDRGQTLVGGHRGANAIAPENTIAGFELARAAGADYVETDVRAARDGTLVLIHDDDVERTTDGHGLVDQLASVELARLDAGSWFSRRFTGQQVPTLDGFLDWIESVPRLGAILEAKARGVGGPLATRLARSPAATRLAICSFDPDELRSARSARPDGLTILLLGNDHLAGGDPVELARAARSDGAALIGRTLTARRVAALHAAGLLVGAGTRDRAVAIERVLGLGADLLDSNRPSVAVRVRDRRAPRSRS